MKRLYLRVLKVCAGIVLLGAIGAVACLQHPLFGALPQGERLARILRSPNYAGGAFRNQIDSPMLTTNQPEWEMWMETVFGRGKGQPRPPGAIPAIRTNLKALDPAQDLVVWLGHSSYFVQLGGKRILIDPVFSTNAAPVPRTSTAFDGTSIYAAEDMPGIDALLITHDHYDHLDYRTIQALRPKVKRVVTGLGVGAHFEAWGYDMSIVREADWNDVVELTPALHVHVTPARHLSGRGLTRNQSLWAGFAIISPNRRIFFSGDSGYAPHFREIGRRLGPFDWVALDTGQYDPRWANVHMNPEQAAQAAEDLRTRVLTPAHVGRFSIAPHDWDDPFKRITVASEKRDYALWTPKIGRPMYLDGRMQKFPPWWGEVEPDRPRKGVDDHAS
ncbi:MBL fold metallo-hydrolase [Burkholderia pseudomultivorans]|uniref:MBL fold metallo-hydrolase n=1 Tax=Burkholderia pseudomultivorans TaxID=1207504 RepID=UPI0001FD9B92|nr:MBL fold metallo-hydrolase [Burkholderia pseudomultivorans]EGD01817.1 outer membrane protein [Burkholderia sp. TJI49]KVC24526.1 MBL fold metallo-hydrolase [Burkholderia pseudomultivorans]KVC25465.1 MBL fold metallo-hydrolase [Burkholderia pseudomultivorans]KVC45551.1 MBL fold metallo-hydrolase [Burkholderia pseudomultivorans]